MTSSSYYKLGVVNEATVISVNSLEHLLDFLVRHNPSIVFKITGLDFLHIKFTVTISIECLKDLGEVVTFLLAHELRGDESVGGLFKGHIAVEAR